MLYFHLLFCSIQTLIYVELHHSKPTIHTLWNFKMSHCMSDFITRSNRGLQLTSEHVNVQLMTAGQPNVLSQELSWTSYHELNRPSNVFPFHKVEEQFFPQWPSIAELWCPCEAPIRLTHLMSPWCVRITQRVWLYLLTDRQPPISFKTFGLHFRALSLQKAPL